MQTPYISSEVLSKELDIPASSIRHYRNNHGVKTKFKLSYVSKEEFIYKYQELKSQEEMAKYYNVDHHTINDFSKSIGFDDSLYKRTKLTESQISHVIQNYDKKSSTELAKEMNISSSAISGVWHRNELKGKTRRVYYLLNEDYFEKIDSQDKAYFLGFIGSDGCLFKPNVKNKQNILKISIHKQDEKILKMLKEYLQTNKPISNNGTYVSLEISSNKIFNDIEKLGLSTNKTYKNTIANIPKQFMPSLIRGYFDGDGSIGNHKSILKASVSIAGYQSNMDKFKEYLEENNIYASIVYDKRDKNKAIDGSQFCSLCFGNKTSKYSFLKLIYENSNNLYLDRKFNKSMEFIKTIEASTNIRDKQIVNYYNYAVQKVC